MINIRKVIVSLVDAGSLIGLGVYIGNAIGKIRSSKKEYIRTVRKNAELIIILMDLDEMVINHGDFTDEEKLKLKEEKEDIRNELEIIANSCDSYKKAIESEKIFDRYKNYTKKIGKDKVN